MPPRIGLIGLMGQIGPAANGQPLTANGQPLTANRLTLTGVFLYNPCKHEDLD